MMDLNELAKAAKENDLVIFTRQDWEKFEETICDKLCVVPHFFDEESGADICENCPVVRMEEKRHGKNKV